MAQSSLYDLLGVATTATPEEIKAAYRTKVMKYHPDRNPGNADAEEHFKAIQKAYDILSDPVKRAEYDATGDTEQTRDINAIAREILTQMFINIANAMTENGNPHASVQIGRTDPFNILHGQLREQARGIERQAQTNMIACERLKQILARVQSKKQPVGETHLYLALQQQIAQMEARKLSIERDRELNMKLQELATDFTYQLDVEYTQVRTGNTASATTGTLFLQNHG